MRTSLASAALVGALPFLSLSSQHNHLLRGDGRTMRAVVFDTRGMQCSPEHPYFNSCELNLEKTLQVRDVQRPQLKRPGMAMVRVAATSVNPCDWETVQGGGFQDHVPGLDVAGIVEEAGPECPLRPGQHVWGHTRFGGAAEFTVSPCNMLSPKPENLTFSEAASIPIAALTGLKGLQRTGAPWKSKPTVLVTAGAGGVGTVAIQLAKALGAGKVITTCSPSHFDLVKSLGADEVIDYNTAKWWEVLEPRSVNVIYNVIPQRGDGERALEVLALNGTYLQLLTVGLEVKPESCDFMLFRAKDDPDVRFRCRQTRRPDLSFLDWELHKAESADLDFLRSLVEASGKLRPVIDSVYSMDNASKAFEASHSRHSAGKIVLRVAEL